MGGSHKIPNIGKTGERIVVSSSLENGHESVRFCTDRVVTPSKRNRQSEEGRQPTLCPPMVAALIMSRSAATTQTYLM
jgi:hypothetical protein